MIRWTCIAILFAAPITAAEPVAFRRDAIAALSRAGCNQGACHGSPQGKNGFRLSLRGFDPDLDIHTIAKEAAGRRVNIAQPDDSLILLKGSGRVSHQGGIVFKADDPAYQTLRAWIEAGCSDSGPSLLTKLEVLPASRKLPGDNPTLKLSARAHFQDGGARDVTDLAVFSSSEPGFAPVTPDGTVTFGGTGEASILVRYLDQVTSVRLTYVRPDPKFIFQGPEPANIVDRHVFAKQKELQLSPAPLATDEVFLRRVYLDLIGGLPTPEEAREFLDSKDPNRRAKLIDRLLDRDEYAYFWALKWADILRGSPTTISERGVHSFHRYLVRMMAEDRPLHDFATELLTGLGNTLHKPAANFFRIARTPEESAEAAAQIFLGVRVQCAKCHNHPFESLTQTDYYGLAAYFAQIHFKGAAFGSDEEIVYLSPGKEINNPRTRKPQEPIAFGSPAGPLARDDDRRRHFAQWLTRPDNKYFAPSVVNRLFFHLMGKGIVDPVDDFRDTNPPSNPQLLQSLVDEFLKQGSRQKPLLRLILNSRTYQLAGAGGPPASPYAAQADRYFTKSAIRMLSAEQILDAVSQATGIAETFKGYPAGTLAIELPEGGIQHPFLQAFSRPVRDATCECAREEDPSLPQILHLLNNGGLVEKVKSSKNRIAGWLKESKDDAWVAEQIYLATLSRRPTAKEREIVMLHLKDAKDRAAGFQDVQYALLNLNEFLLRH